MEANDALELERLSAAARDALTDEMVGRIAASAAGGMELLDQISRARVDRALPALVQLIENGDLDRLVGLARVVGAAQDALTDEMVSRVAHTLAGSLSLMDQLNRTGIERIVSLLERVVGALESADKQMATRPSSRSGLAGLMQMMRDREHQETLRYLLCVGRGIGDTKSTS